VKHESENNVKIHIDTHFTPGVIDNIVAVATAPIMGTPVQVRLSALPGPATFIARLAAELFRLGHQVNFASGDESDVSLVVIEPTGRPLALRTVQRLDGIWFRPQDFDIKNKSIRSFYEKTDHVIFQSLFDQNMIFRWWGDQQKSTIIHNGIDLTPCEKITFEELTKIQNTYDKVFVCSANWHPQKRLKANLELFDHIRKTQHPNSCMIVMGANPDVIVSDPHIRYTHSLPHDVCQQIYAMADWMFHLAWADHCPNVVVEALAQGTPVVCSSVGGTKELIGSGAYGMVLKENPYNFELADYDNPPAIDVTQVTFLPTRHELDYKGILNIDIKSVAQCYVSVFEKLLKQK
jgi:glycosyltransferase involved in cell wall biosynthesis